MKEKTNMNEEIWVLECKITPLLSTIARKRIHFLMVKFVIFNNFGNDPFVHSFKILNTYYVPGHYLPSGAITVNKTHKNPCSYEVHILVRLRGRGGGFSTCISQLRLFKILVKIKKNNKNAVHFSN